MYRNKVVSHLLLKDDVGKPKPTTRNLPDISFTYGKPDIKDPEDASKGKLAIVCIKTIQLQLVGAIIGNQKWK